jgi:ubiquinone/menaquinone biosynthesis C-methylase UbiE/uncharacterized protein YbaR (Trm112 family)|tara:strand:- start:110 stop:1096 length:987 start_codon:yes stop_codon:yes gene_type:complete
MTNSYIDQWYLDNLVCPIDKSQLAYENNQMHCIKHSHIYNIFRGIPIMLVDKYQKTNNLHSLRTVNIVEGREKLRFDLQRDLKKNEIDPLVQEIIAETNSNFYTKAVGKLKTYTIPDFPISTNDNKHLLDVGCGWGRWCISSSKSGFDTIGIDPCIDSIMAAIRISKQLNIKTKFVIGDARFLPFKKDLFDNCFSFSVFQHFIKEDVKKILEGINFTLKVGGISNIHMLNKYGLRSLCMQIKHIFKKYEYFQTTYWSSSDLISLFNIKIGHSKVVYLSFFTQAQYKDYHLFKPMHKLIFNISKILNSIALKIPFIKYFADNIYIISKK